MNIEQLALLNLDQLMELKNHIDYLIKDKQQEQKKNLINEFKQQAAKYGLTLEDVVASESSKGRKTKGQKVPPKYQHPNDPSMTWTGRGRKPLWVEELLNSGKSKEDLEI